MYILGINFSYDAACSLIKDGSVTAACQEERFKRVKHYAGFPSESLNFCLKHAGITMNDVDAVAFFWNPAIHAQAFNWRLSSAPRHHLEFLHSIPGHLLNMIDERETDMLEQIIYLKNGKKLPIFYVTHHSCHSAGALFSSPFEETAILTLDGYGERESCTISTGKGKTIKKLWFQEFPHSLGSFYAAFTQYLGFKPNSGEGKLMGLASYGDRKSGYAEKVRKMVRLTEEGFELDLSYFSFFLERQTRYSTKFIDLLGDPRKPESTITKRHEDIAAACQTVLEDTVIHLARIARRKTGIETLSMSGGVTLNCLANGRILDEGIFRRHFFHPASSDAGSSIGAALWVYHEVYDMPRTSARLCTEYLGPEFSNDQIKIEIEKGGLKYGEPEDPEKTSAELLASGKIGSVFSGRAEFGPRALGNRSTIADPRNPAMKDILNRKVKFREPFRPYAPSVLEEKCGEYFHKNEPSPFMLRVYKTLESRLDEIPSITHVDGGARVQTVTREQNAQYYQLIENFGKITGTYLILNTSFNIRGEPIVNTPSDALKCFLTTGMDFLLIGNFLLIK
jgi:carbamoyltransferase